MTQFVKKRIIYLNQTFIEVMVVIAKNELCDKIAYFYFCHISSVRLEVCHCSRLEENAARTVPAPAYFISFHINRVPGIHNRPRLKIRFFQIIFFQQIRKYRSCGIILILVFLEQIKLLNSGILFLLNCFNV